MKNIKKMASRSICFLLPLLMILLMFSSCAGGGRGALGLPAPTDHLVVYRSPSNFELIDPAVALYREKFPNVEVEVRDFGDLDDWQEIGRAHV